ncbi:Rhomboid- protein 2, variant 2 [Dermatophagoides farinae]|uniref:Rhomboid- protein 2, variant 2 n=1 Tax=Dermatophagoides farinae TaxID=6954 RepID=A0A922HSH4_DERFA|nr:Rhomboid- protein 2, variant 2 [Dermatophagoides farinae]
MKLTSQLNCFVNKIRTIKIGFNHKQRYNRGYRLIFINLVITKQKDCKSTPKSRISLPNT